MEVTKQDASMQKYAAAKMVWKQKLRREKYWEKMVNKNRFSQVVHTNRFSGQFSFFIFGFLTQLSLLNVSWWIWFPHHTN